MAVPASASLAAAAIEPKGLARLPSAVRSSAPGATCSSCWGARPSAKLIRGSHSVVLGVAGVVAAVVGDAVAVGNGA